MEDPELLILDEPTNGLDFDGQREIYGHLLEMRKAGKPILITSHTRAELRILCDRIFVLQGGKLLPAPEQDGDFIQERPASKDG
jgi:ABC-2 type transport system ATP-binding protein